MPSPFPGMDPWLERTGLFSGLHNGLIIYLQAAINKVLPAGYVAGNDNRVYVDPELHRVPDIGVFGPNGSGDGVESVAVATFARAGLLAFAADPVIDAVEEPYLEIRTVDDERLVTAIEVVSPANKKAGESGRTSYQQKQGEFRLGRVNLVEIDLIRGGPHTTAVPETRLRAAGTFDYHVCYTLTAGPRQYFVAPIKLADRLPSIFIPLDSGVTPVTVDLQAVFDRAYDEGGYANRAKYDSRACEPPLTPEQRAWAEGILRAKGLLT
ncbi:MAG: hypothetical protein C0467_12275 [Planctomycetaceae bacterium]|nr:hypothetical protein [Planctomycetaceae bacterium]